MNFFQKHNTDILIICVLLAGVFFALNGRKSEEFYICPFCRGQIRLELRKNYRLRDSIETVLRCPRCGEVFQKGDFIGQRRKIELIRWDGEK